MDTLPRLVGIDFYREAVHRKDAPQVLLERLNRSSSDLKRHNGFKVTI